MAKTRRLILTSPAMTGADVLSLQRALNVRRKRRGLTPISVDGEYGPQTSAAVADMAYRLGLLRSTIQRGATVGVQRVIKHPDTRTPAQQLRAKLRARKQPASTGGAAALAWAVSRIGVKEHPAGSNTGPEIRDWQKAVQMGPGPWCGAFAVASAKAGGTAVTYLSRYTPSIKGSAQAKTGGYRGWLSSRDSYRFADPGDHVVFDWQAGTGADHVGVLESVDLDAGTITTVDGNTSSSAGGSQDNGGTVARRTRPLSNVQGIAQVRWA